MPVLTMRNEREMQKISTVFAGVPKKAEADTAAPVNNRRTTMIALAFGCLFAGFATPFVGLVLLIFHEIFNDGLLNRIGTVLMIVSIPLILLGSILMDLIDGKK